MPVRRALIRSLVTGVILAGVVAIGLVWFGFEDADSGFRLLGAESARTTAARPDICLMHRCADQPRSPAYCLMDEARGLRISIHEDCAQRRLRIHLVDPVPDVPPWPIRLGGAI